VISKYLEGEENTEEVIGIVFPRTKLKTPWLSGVTLKLSGPHIRLPEVSASKMLNVTVLVVEIASPVGSVSLPS
jgi:hypothetical protein